MSTEQAQLQLIVGKKIYDIGTTPVQREKNERHKAKVNHFIKKWIDLSDVDTVAFVNKDFNVRSVDARTNNIISMERLNDVRYINKYLESINESLAIGGHLVGCVEVSQKRKKRIMEKYSWPLNSIYYFFFYLIKRVWPKIPYVNNLFFMLTRGADRVVSELEIYGRLYACGFKLKDTLKTGGLLYFLAEKSAAPDYNPEPTYSPIIKLNRIGKGGKQIKVYKFRTMYPYAEYLQHYIYEKYGLQSGGKFKNDPRVNIIGQYARKIWLDEIPMLWNLLKGDLKIVGVRPISKKYLDLYPAEFTEYRKKFKPGFIPPFYVDLPNTLEEIVESERRYLEAYEKKGFRTDIKYLAKALYNVLFKKARSK